MKSRFNTLDITVGIKELQRFFGMRVVNVYDIDNKTYLIKLGKPDEKAMILLESGIRIHSSDFEWPKNQAPSGFSMKMRKHIRGKRLENVHQLGADRIIDLQFGSGEAAYHVILELYDKGNIVLTDHDYMIVNILRPRTDTCQDVKFVVREKYPLSAAKEHELPTEERLREIIQAAKVGDPLRKVLVPHLDYGPALIDHCLMVAGLPGNAKVGKEFNITTDMKKICIAIEEAEMLFDMFRSGPSKGVIIQKKEKRPAAKDGEPTDLLTYDEFHPMLFNQFAEKPYIEFENFNKCVDEFFSKQESQKLDIKTLQKEKSALKKLENIKKDHEKRIDDLQKTQETDIRKGQMIEMNLEMVDKAILIVRSAIANQIDWAEISNLVKEAQLQQDPVALAIKDLKLQSNQFTMLLKDPYADLDEDEVPTKPVKVDIDIALSAYANSRRFFDMKKTAAKKEQKTLDASSKALKSAERKTKETLKEVATAASINKARKNYWFEKFLWFITSENFLVIGGRDQQQNEIIVKKYLKPGDLYVHADLHGAASCIIKNHTSEPVPPKSLNEAGSMAICNSAAWDAKVITSAWWVYHDQVSKTAPSGEYLTTGSFMIRGRKNFLPPSYLIYGFGFLFKLEEGSVFRHKGERKVRTAEEDEMSVADSVADTDVTENTLDLSEDDSDDDNDDDDVENKDNDNDQNQYDQANPDVTDENDKESDMMQVVEVKIEGQEKEVEAGNNSEEESAFPDTNISLQHVKGDKYELQRWTSNSSDPVEPVEIKPEVKFETGARLTAKQRRDLRKAKKAGQIITQDDEEDKVSWLSQAKKSEDITLNLTSDKQETDDQTSQPAEDRLTKQDSEQQQQQPQPKRGQKSKIKKMKEKYADQDEEEREQKMEILASAGAKAEKKKKGKKAKDEAKFLRQQQQHQRQQQQQEKRKAKTIDVILKPTEEMSLQDTTTEAGVTTEPTVSKPVQDADSDDEKQEEEQTPVADQDIQILDSLTGIPSAEDELLYAIPVCAPYNSLVNYKYKVKLTPGSTKRGKAAKLAFNMFQHDKNATSREKDLIRILKEVDHSRNIPGKVKVSAPNLHRKKGK